MAKKAKKSKKKIESKRNRKGVFIAAGVGAFLFTYGTCSLIRNSSSESEIPRPARLSQIEGRLELIADSATPQELSQASSEDLMLYDDEELEAQRILGRDEINESLHRNFSDASFAEYAFYPNSTGFKIYSAAVSKSDAKNPEDAVKLAEQLMPLEDSLYKEGSVASVLGEDANNYFAYLGFVSPKKAAEWKANGKIPEASKQDIKDFKARFESIKQLARENGRILQEQDLESIASSTNVPESLRGILFDDSELIFVEYQKLQPFVQRNKKVEVKDSHIIKYKYQKDGFVLKIEFFVRSRNDAHRILEYVQTGKLIDGWGECPGILDYSSYRIYPVFSFYDSNGESVPTREFSWDINEERRIRRMHVAELKKKMDSVIESLKTKGNYQTTPSRVCFDEISPFQE